MKGKISMSLEEKQYYLQLSTMDKLIYLTEMIYKKVDEYSSLIKISEFYEDKTSINYEFESMSHPIEYMQKNWEDDKNISYIIWGMTQTAEMLYQYISKNYKNADLIGVIDLYREKDFHGIMSSDLSILEQINTNTYIFVAVESANVMAVNTFKSLNIKNYVLCWEKQDYKLPVGQKEDL